MDKVGAMELRITEADPVEPRKAESCVDQISVSEIFTAEIWAYITMFFSPLVPHLYSLFEDLTILLACHVPLLSFSREQFVVPLRVVGLQASQIGDVPAAQRVQHTLARLGADAPQSQVWSFANNDTWLARHYAADQDA